MKGNALVALAREAVVKAEDNLLEVMKREFPMGQLVRVSHVRGEFLATVVGWDTNGLTIGVRNNVSGKITWQWYPYISLHGN